MSVALNSSPSNLDSLNKSSNWKKRPASDDDDEAPIDSKKPKYSWYVTLEQESSTSLDEDEESIYTVQGYETEYAKDTSDTSTHSLCTSSDEGQSDHEEYELASEEENEDPFLINTSSSEPENILAVEIFNLFDTDGLADDSEDSRCSFDGEIRRADFRTCIQCKNRNNNPQFRYCERCFQLRKAHVVPRSRPRRKPRNHIERSSSSTVSLTSRKLSQLDSGLSTGNRDLDSTDGSQQDKASSSQEFKTPNERNISKDKFRSDKIQNDLMSTESDNSQIFSQESGFYSSQDLDKGSSDSLSRDSKNDNSSLNQTKDESRSEISSSMELISSQSSLSELQSHPENDWNSPCLFCTVNPRDSGFPHGKSMHVCCCYTCAKKVWNSNGNRCPICKVKVNRIMKVYL